MAILKIKIKKINFTLTVYKCSSRCCSAEQTVFKGTEKQANKINNNNDNKTIEWMFIPKTHQSLWKLLLNYYFLFIVIFYYIVLSPSYFLLLSSFSSLSSTLTIIQTVKEIGTLWHLHSLNLSKTLSLCILSVKLIHIKYKHIQIWNMNHSLPLYHYHSYAFIYIVYYTISIYMHYILMTKYYYCYYYNFF